MLRYGPRMKHHRDEPDSLDETDRVVIEALWSGVINDWEHEGRHDELIDFARVHSVLFEAARRYRALRDDPDRGERARRRLKTIAVLATTVLLPARSDPALRSPPLGVYVLAGVVCAALLISLWLAYHSAAW